MGWWINKSRVVVMPNGERWAVPVLIIIEDRAKYMFKEHPDEFPTLGDAIKDTAEYFADDDNYQLHDWASNNMNWSDVAKYAFKVAKSKPITEEEKQEAWVNGEAEVEKVSR